MTSLLLLLGASAALIGKHDDDDKYDVSIDVCLTGLVGGLLVKEGEDVVLGCAVGPYAPKWDFCKWEQVFWRFRAAPCQPMSSIATTVFVHRKVVEVAVEDTEKKGNVRDLNGELTATSL